MANLVITDTAVVAITSLNVTSYLKHYLAGVALVAGKSVYLDTNSVWQLATSAAVRTTFGITMNNAAAGQSVGVLTISGTVDLGVSLSQGRLYGISGTAGMIRLISELVATEYTNVLGYANASDQLVLTRVNIPTVLA